MVPLLAAFAITAVGVTPINCGDTARIEVDLQRSPIESKARGAVRVLMDAQRSVLELRLRGLDPESEHLLLADGVERTRFATNSRGDAIVELRYPPEAGIQTLDFDPRGKLLAVSDGSLERLSAVVSGPLEPDRIRIWELAAIPATAQATGGQATGSYQSVGNSWRVFEVQLLGVESGTYQVLVDGAPVGELALADQVFKSIRFISTPRFAWLPKLPGDYGPRVNGRSRTTLALLDFEPRGARIEIARSGEVLFAGPMRARVALPEEAETCPIVDLQTPLTPVLWFGSGEASLVSKDESCDHEFRVTAQGLAAANYELWVGEAMVGTVPVRNSAGGPAGEIRFDTHPDDPGELPLGFDPRGQQIEVRRPMFIPNLYLTALFPTE
jgi:hypothetical protein